MRGYRKIVAMFMSVLMSMSVLLTDVCSIDAYAVSTEGFLALSNITEDCFERDKGHRAQPEPLPADAFGEYEEIHVYPELDEYAYDPQYMINALSEKDSNGDFVIPESTLIEMHLTRQDIIDICQAIIDSRDYRTNTLEYSYYQETWTHHDAEYDDTTGEETKAAYDCWEKSYPKVSVTFNEEDLLKYYEVSWQEILVFLDACGQFRPRQWKVTDDSTDEKFDINVENTVGDRILDTAIKMFKFRALWVWNGADASSTYSFYAYDKNDGHYDGHVVEETSYKYQEYGDWTDHDGTVGEVRWRKKIPTSSLSYVYNDFHTYQYLQQHEAVAVEFSTAYHDYEHTALRNITEENHLAQFLNIAHTLYEEFNMDYYMVTLKLLKGSGKGIEDMEPYYEIYQHKRKQVEDAEEEEKKSGGEKKVNYETIFGLPRSEIDALEDYGTEKGIIKGSDVKGVLLGDEDITGKPGVWDEYGDLAQEEFDAYETEVSDAAVNADIASGLYTKEDYLYMCACIQGEGYGYLGKWACANCVMNRVKSGSFPNTVKDVVTASGQFTGYHHTIVTGAEAIRSETRNAAVDVLRGSSDTLGGACYYFGEYPGGAYYMFAEASKCSGFWNILYNVFYREAGSLHNKVNTLTTDAVIIKKPHAKHGEWDIESGQHWTRTSDDPKNIK